MKNRAFRVTVICVDMIQLFLSNSEKVYIVVLALKFKNFRYCGNKLNVYKTYDI